MQQKPRISDDTVQPGLAPWKPGQARALVTPFIQWGKSDRKTVMHQLIILLNCTKTFQAAQTLRPKEMSQKDKVADT